MKMPVFARCSLDYPDGGFDFEATISIKLGFDEGFSG